MLKQQHGIGKSAAGIHVSTNHSLWFHKQLLHLRNWGLNRNYACRGLCFNVKTVDGIHRLWKPSIWNSGEAMTQWLNVEQKNILWSSFEVWLIARVCVFSFCLFFGGLGGQETVIAIIVLLLSTSLLGRLEKQQHDWWVWQEIGGWEHPFHC